MKNSTAEKAIEVFRQHGGLLSRGEAINLGIHQRTLYAMRDAGIVIELARGKYRLADLPPMGNPDLVSIALKVPTGILCLISALSFHEITTQIPFEVYVALRRGAPNPKLEYPPMRVFWFPGESFCEGEEHHDIGGATIRVYCPERTIADCFKYRNKIGLDIAVEALRLYCERKQRDMEQLRHYARLRRVEKTMKPYMCALTITGHPFSR